jgi:hypothetical protein
MNAIKLDYKFTPGAIGVLLYDENEKIGSSPFFLRFQLHPPQGKRGTVVKGEVSIWNGVHTYATGAYIVGDDGETLVQVSDEYAIKQWVKNCDQSGYIPAHKI